MINDLLQKLVHSNGLSDRQSPFSVALMEGFPYPSHIGSRRWETGDVLGLLAAKYNILNISARSSDTNLEAWGE